MTQVLIQDTGVCSNVGVPLGSAVTTTGNGVVPPELAPDNNPVVEITSPADLATITTQTVSFLATAMDADGIDRVEMYVDNVLKATESTAPYGWGGADGVPDFDLSGYANGSLAFKVIAFDNDVPENSTQVIHTVTLDYDPGGGGTPGVADWYISPSGSNTTGNGTSGNPWQTIPFAYSQAAKGDVIEMAGGTYSGGTIPFSSGKDVAVTLPTATGQTDVRWAETPTTFTVATGGAVNTGSLTIEGTVEFDGSAGTLTIPFAGMGSGGGTVSTGKVGMRDLKFTRSTTMNSFAAWLMVDCVIGENASQDNDVMQMKANASGVAPRNFYARRCEWVSAIRPSGSANHVDTIQIGGMTGLWFEECYVRNTPSPDFVQGFFAKGWTNPTSNAKVHKCWLQHANISEPNTDVDFFGCEGNILIDPGFGTQTGTIVQTASQLETRWDANERPWD